MTWVFVPGYGVVEDSESGAVVFVPGSGLYVEPAAAAAFSFVITRYPYRQMPTLLTR